MVQLFIDPLVTSNPGTEEPGASLYPEVRTIMSSILKMGARNYQGQLL